MTQRRQERKGRCNPVWLTVIAGGFLALQGAPAAAQATTERVVVNRSTGLAIDGYDPVAFFAESKPLAGRAEFEAVHDGAIWRFRNEGNRAAFLAHPEIYQPQFGGYDPVDVGRGVPVEGRPSVWAVVNQRLFLFSSGASRTDFTNNPGGSVTRAKLRWSELRSTLAE